MGQTFNRPCGEPGWGERIGAAFPLQSTAHASGLWLTEASVERQPGTGSVGLKLGLFALNPDFIEAPVLNAYVHSALNNTLNLNVTGLPINPAIAPGVRLSWTPAADGRWGSWQAGSFWLDQIDELAGLLGVNPGLTPATGSLELLQWRFERLPGWQEARTALQHREGAGAAAAAPAAAAAGGRPGEQRPGRRQHRRPGEHAHPGAPPCRSGSTTGSGWG